MSYTTSDNIKRYLTDSFPRLSSVADQTFRLSGTDYLPFFGGAVESDSFRVKSVQTSQPTRVELAFSIDRISLSINPLVSGSIVVATDSSLGAVYTENVDYIVDIGHGDIIRKASGAIPFGQTVVVWFIPFTLYTLDSDYNLDSDAGEIRRLSGGNISADETVYLDYTPILKAYNDEVIDGAVALANGLIQNELDPNGDFGADPALETAATFKALAIICQTSAVRDLSQNRTARAVSTGWLQLSDSFDRKADAMVKNYRPPFNNPNAPVIG